MNILFIPDTQAKPGQDFEFLRCIGRFIVAEKPDVIVHAGDFSDLPSLSSYDRGKLAFEGRRYRADVEATHQAMEALLGPLRDYNQRRLASKHSLYRPRLVLTLGNHENRINRAVQDEPFLAGAISVDDLQYEKYGWEVYPFLEVVVINGVCFSHFFVSGTMGRPASSAQAMLNKRHMSMVAGHQQGRQMATAFCADGRQITAVIAGSCYEAMEDYLGPQGNKHWHGLLMMRNVENGQFDEHFLPLADIKKKYAA